MDFKIIEKEAFRVVGKSIRVTAKDGENLRQIPGFWDKCHEDGTSDRLCELSETKNILGICMEFDPVQEDFSYMIAVESGNEKHEGMTVKTIPAATWAVFQSIGPMPVAIQKVTERIFSEWFPATDYVHADGPELEVYPPGDVTDENYYCEVWIPVVRK